MAVEQIDSGAGVQAGPMGVDAAYAVLAENLAGFEQRPEQRQLTDKIADALYFKTHLVAEAPTGTGKSFAVTLGVISEFLGHGKKAIIATANNNLLEQYASKDLPFLQKIFPSLRWARAKGKNNYACIDKAEKLFGQQVLFADDSMKRLQGWYDNTLSGDREEIAFGVKAEEWLKINADDTCTGRKCPFYDDCHYFKAKRQLQTADIIVTNFDLVLLELLNPSITLFPKYDALIFDEAHHLEEKAISKMEQSLTQRQVEGYLERAKKNYGVSDSDDAYQQTHKAIQHLFNHYKSLLQSGEEKQSIVPVPLLKELTDNFVQTMGFLRFNISKFKTALETRERKAQDNLMDAVTNAGIAALAVITNDERHVSWVEKTKTDIKIVCCPFRVQYELYQALFTDPELTVVTLSATLAAGGGKQQFTATKSGLQPVAVFQQYMAKIGMTQAAEFLCPSPFDYRQNCVLYLPTPPEGLDSPNKEAWKPWAKEQMLDLVKLSKGRAFVLTTSSKLTTEFGDYLSAASGFPVKIQGTGTSNSQLIDWFKKTPNAIIVGTASFWEGVSVEGDDLKLVIIDKIPFTPHTDPVQQAREAWYKADPTKKNKAFMDLQLYPAIIRLKQGFGRLIRTKADTGVVALLDPRLSVSRYRNTVLNSLPDAPRVTDINDERLERMLR